MKRKRSLRSGAKIKPMCGQHPGQRESDAVTRPGWLLQRSRASASVSRDGGGKFGFFVTRDVKAWFPKEVSFGAGAGRGEARRFLLQTPVVVIRLDSIFFRNNLSLWPI